MSQANTKDLTTLPVGRLGLIPLISCKDLGEKVNDWLIQWRKERSHDELGSRQHVSVPERPNVLSWNPSAAMISISW